MVRAIYPGNTSWRVLKDMYKRQMVAEHEPTRQALRYIVRNTTLPPKVRMKAQLQLNAMPISTRTTAVQNRCVETGRARGVFRDFRLARVSAGARRCGWLTVDSFLLG